MSQMILREGYASALSLFDTQMAIELIKRTFEDRLRAALNLRRVSAPLFVDGASGLNDDLNGVERPVSFSVRETGQEAQIVHSLAKWKRYALGRYEFRLGKGLYTDMNAIRRDEEMDNFHSIYVDQWDWEKVLRPSERNVDTLREAVCAIVNAICGTLDVLRNKYDERITLRLSRDVSFVTTRELWEKYPDLTPKERENAYVKEHPTTFLMQIGDCLPDGTRHDGRAPDYDDWSLNGDLLFWHPVMECALEISSMGIRVDAQALEQQLEKANCTARRALPFHKMLLEGKLPQTIGGGIGQSRLCMLLLQKLHIGEVQVSLWDAETQRLCAEHQINLL